MCHAAGDDIDARHRSRASNSTRVRAHAFRVGITALFRGALTRRGLRAANIRHVRDVPVAREDGGKWCDTQGDATDRRARFGVEYRERVVCAEWYNGDASPVAPGTC
jgi:hypothetical protein